MADSLLTPYEREEARRQIQRLDRRRERISRFVSVLEKKLDAVNRERAMLETLLAPLPLKRIVWYECERCGGKHTDPQSSYCSARCERLAEPEPQIVAEDMVDPDTPF